MPPLRQCQRRPQGPVQGADGRASRASPSWTPGLPGCPRHERRLGSPACRSAAGAARSRGLTSVCSAHPWVIEAALAAPGEATVLIEATCNQVNQEGGYTGMTPADFRGFVEGIAQSAGFARDAPHPRRRSSRPQSVEASAGRRSDAAGARRWSRPTSRRASPRSTSTPAWAASASRRRSATRSSRRGRPASPRSPRRRPSGRGSEPPVYVIGTEVPPPGGATHSLDAIEVTRPEAALATLAEHRRAFASAGHRQRLRAGDRGRRPARRRVRSRPRRRLTSRRRRASSARCSTREPASSSRPTPPTTSRPSCSSALVDDGFAILKVGPALTFAMREALYGLDRIADASATRRAPTARSRRAMERLMLAQPGSLAALLWRHAGRAAPAPPLQLQRPHPLLLAGARGARRRWPS